MRPLHEVVAQAMGATRAKRKERIQSLWGGYGEVVRFRLTGADVPSVVVKQVLAPDMGGDAGHRRKLRSYEVELDFYARWAPRCQVRVPTAFHLADGLFILEDLDAAGFPGRGRGWTNLPVEACVRWLAGFHRSFLNAAPEGLWPVGTYWHLDTRGVERKRMAPGPLRDAASALDARLSRVKPKTVVHGDAKLANFCFGSTAVAAVDFQYVGGGMGLKDLAYFLGSCLDDDTLERTAAEWLDLYFTALDDAEAEAAWRPLWPHAWADFERFMGGWSPGHRSTGYAARMTQQALGQLDGG